jgi:predicted transcriptional regulator
MSTTSLKLSEELKQRAAMAAGELGISPHAFMVEAIRQAADAVEQRAQFIEQAQTARAEMLDSGLGFDANDVRSYLRQRLAESSADRPNAMSWRK